MSQNVIPACRWPFAGSDDCCHCAIATETLVMAHIRQHVAINWSHCPFLHSLNRKFLCFHHVRTNLSPAILPLWSSIWKCRSHSGFGHIEERHRYRVEFSSGAMPLGDESKAPVMLSGVHNVHRTAGQTGKRHPSVRTIRTYSNCWIVEWVILLI